MKTYKYHLVAFLAFMLWGFFSLALKPIAYVPSFDVLFFRILFSVFLITLFAIIAKKETVLQSIKKYKTLNQVDKRKSLVLNITGGILLGLNWFLFIYVVNHVNVKTASYAYLICPILTSLLSFVILKERLNNWQKIAIGVCTIGSVLFYISSPNHLLFAIIVALSYALYLISQKKNTYFDKFFSLIIQLYVIFILAIPYYIYHGFYFPTNIEFYFYILCIAVFFTVVPLYMNLYALQGISASSVGIMLYVNPLITFCVALFYFNEPINILQITSYFLILVSIFIFNIKFFTKNDQ